MSEDVTSDWVPAGEAARILACSTETVRRLARRGELVACRRGAGGRLLVSRASAQALLVPARAERLPAADQVAVPPALSKEHLRAVERLRRRGVM